MITEFKSTRTSVYVNDATDFVNVSVHGYSVQELKFLASAMNVEAKELERDKGGKFLVCGIQTPKLHVDFYSADIED